MSYAEQRIIRREAYHARHAPAPPPQPSAAESIRHIREERARRQAEDRRAAMERSAESVRVRCADSLYEFVKEAWHVLEPHTRFVDGWAIEAIAEHLQAVTEGELIRLLINCPPGLSKSLLTSVFFPAWEWGPANLPGMRYLSTSYSEAYVIRDTRKMRNLVQSEWYQAHWGDRVTLTRAGEKSFENSATGSREGRPWSGLRGGRGDRLIIDDPHSTTSAESDQERMNDIRILREEVPSRISDPVKSAIVVIMQRLHEGDVSGVILSEGMGYEHLMLPMEYEPERRCYTSVGFVDPRNRDGELLFPERFPKEVVERDKAVMTDYAIAGQYQQRPVGREGGLFKRAYFANAIIDEAPAGCDWVRHWDLAATKRKGAARTAGVKMGRAPDGTFIVGHCAAFREEAKDVRQAIMEYARIDGTGVEISLPQDPGQAGKAQAASLVSMLAGWTAVAEPETGDKYTRAEPFAAQCKAGNVKIVRGDWNAAFIDEHCGFPNAVMKDRVDASSGAFARLVLKPAGGAVTKNLRGGW